MNKSIRITRRWLLFFICILLISGLTAIPAESGLEMLSRFFPVDTVAGEWFYTAYTGLHHTHRQYPFLAYGYDWLAFAHLVLAVLFIGPYRDPVRNKWVIESGIIACLLILPFALVAGHFRGIPTWWRLIDCSFGVLGLIPLEICRRQIQKLETFNSTINEYGNNLTGFCKNSLAKK